jgi:hypothetical protein
MSLAMHSVDGGCGWCLDEAESRPPLFVEPVRKDLACTMCLDLKILLVECGNSFCGYASNVVAVHKDWHDAPPSGLFYTPLHRARLNATV